MIELVIRSQASSLTALSNRATFARWTDKLCALSRDALEELAPLLGGDEAADTLRKLIGMCPDLTRPEQALVTQFFGDRDEFVAYAYRLSTIAHYLDKRCTKPQTLDAWCRQTLERTATTDNDFAIRLVHWCTSMIQRFRPTTDDVSVAEDGPQ
jgi:hypothetical protein